jgi:hypothetical protein
VPKNLVVIESRALLALIPQTIISIRLFFWTFPFSVAVATFLIPLEINGTKEILIWFWIAVIGHFSMLPFVIYTKDKKGQSKQIPLLLMMGVVRGGVIGLLSPLFGVVDPLEIPWRVINSMVSMFYWFLIAAIIFEFQSVFRKELTKKIKEAMLKNAKIEDFSYDVNSQVLLARISQLQQKISATLNGVLTQENFEARAKEIDQLVRKHIRPLSKTQWKDGELVWANAGPIKVLWETLNVAPLHVWAVAILTLPYSLIGQYNRYGLVGTLVTQATWLCAAWFVPLIARRLQPAKDGKYLKQNLIILLQVIVLVTPVVYWIHGIWSVKEYGVWNQITGHVFSVVTVISVLLVSSVIISLQEERAYVFEILSNAIKESRFEQFIKSGKQANMRSEYGQYLHAEVQSQLLACKLLLFKAAESNFTLFEPEITNQINQRLEQIQLPYVRPAVRIPSERVAELSKSWKGLAEITYEFSPEMSESNSNSDVISQLIEESVVNSIRHGKAKKIHFENFSAGNKTDFVVTDDGYFIDGKSKGGLGTILFNAFTESWSISRENGQTILKFSVRN